MVGKQNILLELPSLRMYLNIDQKKWDYGASGSFSLKEHLKFVLSKKMVNKNVMFSRLTKTVIII